MSERWREYRKSIVSANMSFIVVVVVVVFVISFIVIVVAILTAAVAHRLQYCLISFALQFFSFFFLINQEHESIFYHASQTHGSDSLFIFSSFAWHFHHFTNFSSIFYLIFFSTSCFYYRPQFRCSKSNCSWHSF